MVDHNDWYSGIQMEFSSQSMVTLAFCKISELFQGYSITIHRVRVAKEIVNVHDLNFVLGVIGSPGVYRIKKVFKDRKEAKNYMNEKHLNGPWVLFDRSNRPENERNLNHIELMTNDQVGSTLMQYNESIEKLNKLFSNFEE